MTEPALSFVEQQPSVDRSVTATRIVGTSVGLSAFAVFAMGWITGSLFWHLAFIAWYAFIVAFVWFVSAIPRNRQKKLDLQWARRFHELSIHDELTGLYNRRHFNQELERLIIETRVTGQPLTLALIDLNGFKRINDTFGHQSGDLALRLVGECISSAVDESAVVARTGGDEFAIILRASTLEANVVLASLRQTLEDTSVAFNGEASGTAQLHAAVGLAALGEFTEAERLLREADGALYANKRELASAHDRRRVA
jgi:diguanylate cyclase (GGDEF)-like protein